MTEYFRNTKRVGAVAMYMKFLLETSTLLQKDLDLLGN